MTCDKCGHDLQIGEYPFCPHVGGAQTVHGDEIDYVDHCLGKEPIRIRSKSERKRLMYERGLEEANYYVEPPPAFEGKPAVQNWNAYADVSPERLAWIAEAMTRGGSKTVEEAPLRVNTFVQRMEVPKR